MESIAAGVADAVEAALPVAGKTVAGFLLVIPAVLRLKIKRYFYEESFDCR